MSNHETINADDFEQFAWSVLDGRATESDFNQLDAILAGNAELQQHYIAICECHFEYERQALSEGNDGKRETDSQASERSEKEATTHAALPSRFRPEHRRLAISIAVAVLVMVSGLATMHFMDVATFFAGEDKKQPSEKVAETPNPVFVARLTNWHKDVWAEGNRPKLNDPRLEIGRKLVLSSGVAEITYDAGARVILEGPAEYEILGSKSGYLNVGRLTAKLDGEKAKGFYVDTKLVQVEDLGTEFGVTVRRDGLGSIVVFEGEVNVNSVETGEFLQKLTADDAVTVIDNRVMPANFGGVSAGYRRVGAPLATPEDVIATAHSVWQLNGDLSNAINRTLPLQAARFTPKFVKTMIHGEQATVLDLPALSPQQGLSVRHNTGGNGAPGKNERTNNWTLVMDVNFGDSLTPFESLVQCNPENSDDVNIFLRPSGGIDLGTTKEVAPGRFKPNTWYRLAIRSRSNGKQVELQASVDGVLLPGGSRNAIDGIGPSETSLGRVFLLFSDDNGDTSPSQVNSIAFWGESLTDDAIMSLGGPAAAGVIVTAKANDRAIAEDSKGNRYEDPK